MRKVATALVQSILGCFLFFVVGQSTADSARPSPAIHILLILITGMILMGVVAAWVRCFEPEVAASAFWRFIASFSRIMLALTIIGFVVVAILFSTAL